jgi:hypothetical protein
LAEGSGAGVRRGAANAGAVAMAAEAARNDRRLRRFMVCGVFRVLRHLAQNRAAGRHNFRLRDRLVQIHAGVYVCSASISNAPGRRPNVAADET